MLSRIDIVLKNDKLHYNMGSIFHGYLMSIIDGDYAEYLHQTALNPFSSFLYFSKESSKHIWRINTLNPLAKKMIIDRLLEMNLTVFKLTHQDLVIEVEKIINYPSETYEELYLNSSKVNDLKIVTPASFKSNNQYQVIPNVSMILSSVINKVNHFSETVKIDDKSVIEEMINHTFISDYNLKSTFYSLERVKIKSFIGYIRLRSHINHEYRQLLSFIINLSEYTGIGMKTALGMGGLHVK